MAVLTPGVLKFSPVQNNSTRYYRAVGIWKGSGRDELQLDVEIRMSIPEMEQYIGRDLSRDEIDSLQNNTFTPEFTLAAEFKRWDLGPDSYQSWRRLGLRSAFVPFIVQSSGLGPEDYLWLVKYGVINNTGGSLSYRVMKRLADCKRLDGDWKDHHFQLAVSTKSAQWSLYLETRESGFNHDMAAAWIGK